MATEFTILGTRAVAEGLISVAHLRVNSSCISVRSEKLLFVDLSGHDADTVDGHHLLWPLIKFS
jgi:hypothetical protein